MTTEIVKPVSASVAAISRSHVLWSRARRFSICQGESS
jgi:hypothetical protein